MSTNNEFNKVQINETIEKDSNGKVLRKSLMINIRSNDVSEAGELYCQLKGKLNGGNNNVPTCECGQPMVLRKGPKGDFYGCSAFPKCRKTKELNGVSKKGVNVKKKPRS